MSHKGVRGPAVPRAAARGRWVRVGPCRTRQPPPFVSRRQPRGDRRRRGPSTAGTRARRPSFVSPRPPPPNPAQRGGGSATAVPVARGPRPKPGTIGGGAQSPPCPPPSPPRSPPRRNMAAQPPLPPSRAGPPAPRSLPAGGRKRLHAATEASPGLLRGPRPGKLRAPPGDCPRGLTKPTRSGGGVQAAPRRAPAPSAHPHAHKVWGPAGSRPRHAARQRAGTSWARPLPARGLPHVPLPPPLCSGGALTLAPGRNFPFPRTPRPACTPRPGGGAGLARPLPEGPLCAPRAHRPPGPAQAGSARVPGAAAARTPPPPTLPSPALPCPSASPRARGQRVAAATRRGGQRPETRPGPRPRRRRHAAPGHSAPPARPPSGLGPHTTGFTHSAEGRADSPGGVAATIFASPAAGSRSRLPTRLRFTTTGGPRPGVRPAGRPAPRRGFARSASRGYAAGVVPTPSASPEGAKWREGAGRAATAAPRRAIIKNKVLPTSPPARQSPQAPPTAARARRLGERELGAARSAALPFPGRASPPPAHRRPPRGAPRPDTSRHASGTPSVNKLCARADPRAPHTLLEAHPSCGFLRALLSLGLDVYAM
ncbi:basic proline-rich protein-like [Eumetopias jubatus]|uniref:basic proline-rich protein-like n=1 Tax=Eumetopias jubatus TaxID=34886 RepID=UPI001016E208|nr:basic proline-rich protein-like [Eumetopias jubatus]